MNSIADAVKRLRTWHKVFLWMIPLLTGFAIAIYQANNYFQGRGWVWTANFLIACAVVMGLALLVDWIFHVQTEQQKSLERRTYELVDELVKFQHEQGPEPPHPLSGKDTVAEQKRVFNQYFDWHRSTYYKYMARYKNRVVQIDHELAAENIYTKLDSRDIDPPENDGKVDIGKIIQALRSAADKIPKSK